MPSGALSATRNIMNAVHQNNAMSAEEYLASEPYREIRHEYVCDRIYPKPGESREHNIIIGNIFVPLHQYLREDKYRIFLIDFKIRLNIANEDIFYYPDILVDSGLPDTDRYFTRHAKVIIEVLSDTTERTDRREKFLSYTQIESLEEYILAAQDKMEVTVFRRANQWKPEVVRLPEKEVQIASLNFNLPLSNVYKGIKFQG